MRRREGLKNEKFALFRMELCVSLILIVADMGYLFFRGGQILYQRKLWDIRLTLCNTAQIFELS
jgi:hypothetical protein